MDKVYSRTKEVTEQWHDEKFEEGISFDVSENKLIRGIWNEIESMRDQIILNILNEKQTRINGSSILEKVKNDLFIEQQNEMKEWESSHRDVIEKWKKNL